MKRREGLIAIILVVPILLLLALLSQLLLRSDDKPAGGVVMAADPAVGALPSNIKCWPEDLRPASSLTLLFDGQGASQIVVIDPDQQQSVFAIATLSEPKFGRNRHGWTDSVTQRFEIAPAALAVVEGNRPRPVSTQPGRYRILFTDRHRAGPVKIDLAHCDIDWQLSDAAGD